MASRVKVITTPSFAAGTAVTAEVASSSPNGIIKTFSGTLAHHTIQNSSITFTVTVTGSPVSITDNGTGTLTGTGVTGTIDYYLGTWTLVCTTAPDNSTNITVNYTWVVSGNTQVTAESTGLSGAAGITKFRGKLAEGKIVPGTVKFYINFLSSAITVTDDKNRSLIHEKLADGYINYYDGTFVLFFLNPPDTSAALTADYQHRNSTYNDPMLKNNAEFYNYIYLYNSSGGTVTARILESDDELTYVENSKVSITNNSYVSKEITPSRYIRLLSWNNSGLTVEFYNK